MWGGEQIVPCTKLFLYLGNVATVRPNPTLNLVLETILVFLGHQSFQGGSKGGGGREGDWGKVGKEIPLALAILVKVL